MGLRLCEVATYTLTILDLDLDSSRWGPGLAHHVDEDLRTTGEDG